MDSCEVNNVAEEGSFQEIYESMQEDSYWMRFFRRPCCPTPNPEEASTMLTMLSLQIDRDPSFTDEEKAKLKEIVESRKEWYPESGICYR